jgi:hypothetical protein
MLCEGFLGNTTVAELSSPIGEAREEECAGWEWVFQWQNAGLAMGFKSYWIARGLF